jgi:hypothetical protein
MTPFRFIHSADLHLGRRFGAFPEEVRGRLVEARHQAIARLAAAARAHQAEHVLVAGDIFDSETPTDPVWRQALNAMAADPGLSWWLIPGNHDSLAAESLWERFRAQAPPHVHLLTEPRPVEIAEGVFLLPAPLPRRYPGRDLTAWMPGAETDPRGFRIGLAHGAVHDFSEDGSRAEGIVPKDRAETARLDYLALGDWHGAVQAGPRAWYAGSPERDGFRHDGRGACLAVTLPAPGAPPEVQTVPTGLFHWSEESLPLLPGEDTGAALRALLPSDRNAWRDHLMRVRATGRATLAGRAALAAAAAAEAPAFGYFELDDTGLETEVDAADLDAIDRAGALRLAADRLNERASNETEAAEARRVAAAALNRLYGYLRGEGA